MKSFLRLLAGLILILPLLWPRPKHDEAVVVMILDGFRRDVADRMAEAGEMPNYAGLRKRGTTMPIAGNQSPDYSELVSPLLGGSSLGAPRNADKVDPREIDTLDGGPPADEDFEDPAPRIVSVGLEGTERVRRRGLIVLPGGSADDGFIGDDTGELLSLRSISKGHVSWPYSLAAAELDANADALVIGQSSPWIHVTVNAPVLTDSESGEAKSGKNDNAEEDAAETTAAVPELQAKQGKQRTGIFKLYRMARDTVFASPIYSGFEKLDSAPSVEDELDADVFFVYGAPSPVVEGNNIDEYYYAHAHDLAETRAIAIESLLSSSGDDVLLYREPLLLAVEAMLFGPGADRGTKGKALGESLAGIPAFLKSAYRDLDRLIGRVTRRVPTRAIIALVAERSRYADPGQFGTRFLLLAGPDGTRTESEAISNEQLLGTLAYVAGLPTSVGSSPIDIARQRFRRERVGDPASVVMSLRDTADEKRLDANYLDSLSAEAPL